MLVQIYEISSPEEAIALGGLGVDHIGVLVGEGEFPRERTIDQARLIFSAIPASSKGVALLLSADVRFIEHVISELKPTILHLGVDRSAHTVDRARAQEAMSLSHRDAQYSGGW
jgi:phosphoribosylanthranilate isomerase